MPRAPKPGYYAVRIGRVPGIYHSWPECEIQINGFPGATYKKLSTETEAIEFMTAKSGATRASASSRDGASVSRSSAEPASKSIIEKDCDVVYCDGACKGNGKVGSIAGVGVWWGHGDPRNIAERCPGDQTNNRAELIAIVRILETTPRLLRPLLIKTDSHYSIQCVKSWIFKWLQNGFVTSDGKPVKNRAVIRYLAALLLVRRKTSQTIEFEHVRGHVGIEGNEAADQLANIGAVKPEVPERDWERLEQEVLRNIESVKPVTIALTTQKAHAYGLLSPPPAQESRHQQWGDVQSAPLITREVLPPLSNITGEAAAGPPRSWASTSHSKYEMPSKGYSRPTGITTTPGPQACPGVMSKEELEHIYASGLLDNAELSSLGTNGTFDSDF